MNFSFRIKLASAACLAAVADQLFYSQPVGWTIGAFDLGLITMVLAVHRPTRRDPRARTALVGAVFFAVLQIDMPTLLNMTLCWLSLAVAVLSARAPSGQTVMRWSAQLVYFAAIGLIGPARDVSVLCRVIGVRRRWFTALLPLVGLPLAGGAVFLLLFALANPVIGRSFGSIRLWAPDPMQLIFLVLVVTALWALLRPRAVSRVGAGRPISSGSTLGVVSVTVCLATFNCVFAIENGLDFIYLWTRGRLPAGVTFAEYAHRGAYALMATAVLAGVFVLLALRPTTTTAASPWPRRLVTLWVAQNLFLVASSILRTLNYVQAYSLTGFRIAALMWMVLVGVGLVLIFWRLIRRKSADWLIGANAVMIGLTLALSSTIELDGVAAAWNVQHAREVGIEGPSLDLCYLQHAGSAALEPLGQLEERLAPSDLHDRVAWVRSAAFFDLRDRQSNWRGWTWRGQRRLRRAAVVAPGGLLRPPRSPGDIACQSSE